MEVRVRDAQSGYDLEVQVRYSPPIGDVDDISGWVPSRGPDLELGRHRLVCCGEGGVGAFRSKHFLVPVVDALPAACYNVTHAALRLLLPGVLRRFGRIGVVGLRA